MVFAQSMCRYSSAGQWMCGRRGCGPKPWKLTEMGTQDPEEEADPPHAQTQGVITTSKSHESSLDLMTGF